MEMRALVTKLKQWLNFRDSMPIDKLSSDLPIASELLIDNQIEQHVCVLSKTHQISKKYTKDVLKKRLMISESILKNTYRVLSAQSKDNSYVTPASEWLMDNFYLIEEQIEIIKSELSKTYEKMLPQLFNTQWRKRYPRIYDIILQIISHNDGRWDMENLDRCITAYQKKSPLTLAELWAVPLMLRLALIENLALMAEKISLNHRNRVLGDVWAEKVLKISATAPKKVVFVLADMVRADIPHSGDFMAQFASRLQNTGAAFPLSWFEQQFDEENYSLEQLIEAENIQQAADQVTTSNIINGLRNFRKVDWRKFVVVHSAVVNTLAQDPTATFNQMDFKTRFQYCEVIQNLARKSQRSEIEVAEATLLLAEKACKQNKKLSCEAESIRHNHVGYYLISNGLLQLKQAIGIKHSFWQKIQARIKKQALALYLGFMLLSISGLTIALLFQAKLSPLSGFSFFIFALILALSLSQLVLALSNWLVMLIIKPMVLPKMDFKAIPEEFRTLVVVPAILSSIEQAHNLLEGLEVHYVGNRQNHLHFALLTDFKDADQENKPEDVDLLSIVVSGIKDLNARYCRENEDIFFLMHRSRLWNLSQKKWMGHERKRGKLSDLNNLLRKNDHKPFSTIIGLTTILAKVKYVITLDSDTLLPPDTAKKLIGVMAHPLNRPCRNQQGQVTSGYGILQPRIGEILTLGASTLYLWLQGAEAGMDPYTHMVSDVYQDLFQEGSFIGKGIYDVDLFQKILVGKFPENLILSHDLIEGCYLRSGLVSDVLFYEASPQNYLTDVQRRSRWIRGDWQLLGWLCSAYPKKMIPLTALSQWKLMDNFRRSLVPISLLSLFFIAILALPATAFWLTVILGIIFLPALLMTLLETLRLPEDILFSQHLTNIMQVFGRRLAQTFYYIACLPYEAFYSLKAILHTLWRLIISKQRLLEWLPSDQIDASKNNSFWIWLRSMWIGPVLALVLLIITIGMHKASLILPLFILWFCSPIFAYYLSRPPATNEPRLNKKQRLFLRKTACKTWGYFETFVNAETHWLPPDNYQETPAEILSLRSSPTNMGMALSANLCAYDFGYLHSGQLLQRTTDSLHTMINLEQYRGHLYNWYDLQTLAPLYPRYISSVDSGNLAGHLLTLRQGLLALPHEPILRLQYIDGLEDSFQLLVEAVSISPLPHACIQFQKLLHNARNCFNAWGSALLALQTLLASAEQMMNLWTDPKEESLIKLAEKLTAQCKNIKDELQIFHNLAPDLDPQINLSQISSMAEAGPVQKLAKERLANIDSLSLQIFQLAQMDQHFLYDDRQHLMAIGFNVEKQILDDNYYDLMASEARLSSFVAIAQDQIEQDNWFALGRMQIMSKKKQPILVSWSGSMFEYLMPLLIMPSYPNSLLEAACKTAVESQIAYGKQQGVPWGISESGYNAIDANYNYQYKAFGVPELGLQPNLDDELVIAPYATVMALMINPLAACENLQALEKLGADGRFGFYEALDYTPGHRQRNQPYALVRSFMAHHQGMSLLAFSYLLHNKPMQKRFTKDPMFQANMLLLQERCPRLLTSYYEIRQLPTEKLRFSNAEDSMQVYKNPNINNPEVQLLSNGDYYLMLTQAGGGYSRCKELALTRWREDSTSDNWGLFSYIRDLKTGLFWSTTYQPTVGTVENFKAVFTEGQAEFSRKDEKINTRTEIILSPEDNLELRRTHLYNDSKTVRELEFTSYAEVVLASQNDDQAQPVFNNLFIQTQCLPKKNAILATRRLASDEQSSAWMFHQLNIHSDKKQEISFETDRVKFIGRGGNTLRPQALINPGALSNSFGNVLDPIVAIRCRITLQPDEMIVFDLFTGIAESYEHCLSLVEKCHDRHFANRIFELSWTHSQVVLHQLNISEADASLYRKLAGSLIYANNSFRANNNLAKNRLGQAKLWPYSISGDFPIILVYIEEASNLNLLKHLIQAQAYWRRKRLYVDLIIINKENFSYRQTLQDQIMALINAAGSHERAGNIYTRLEDQISEEDNILFQSVARLIFYDQFGSLEKQMNNEHLNPRTGPALKISKPSLPTPICQLPLPADLLFFNGHGGFSATGEEYFIVTDAKNPTPAPWVNVLANPHFGSLISESGQGYTWIENAHEFRLTPWNNDPVEDSSGEAFYLRDDESGQFWSPMALPCPGQGNYRIRHGFGYSAFEHIERGISSELWAYVAEDKPIKFMVLKIQNKSNRLRHLSAYGYVEWVLGDQRAKNAMYITTEMGQKGAILAHNYYNTAFGQRTAFFDALTTKTGLKSRSITGSRKEFLGRNGSRQNPAALKNQQLSGLLGVGLDPCAAIQLRFALSAGEIREIIFMLGADRDVPAVEHLLQIYSEPTTAALALQTLRQSWKKTLGTVTLKTPDPAVDFLANGWLIYQTLSSRLWGRSGYYQSSGAFGFRDQLQDTLALVHSRPELLRAQLLLCASRQFIEGDVQHWWHPPQGRGVRTRCSDDYLWLPFALCRYVLATNDIGIVTESLRFLQGRPLKTDEESYYDLPSISNESATLYQHCQRAILHGLELFGVHGLPLMGSGDWNDGMNLVGIKGRGESVWLGFFLYRVLKDFSVLAEDYGDLSFKAHCEEESARLKENLEKEAWDGSWYLRAYFDDGALLGSAQNSECQIDSIAQSWAVLSKSAKPDRAKQALFSLKEHLAGDDLIRLLTPPFDKSLPSPGYIKGYVPGIRENGGQYTHAAVWAVMAFAALEEYDIAWELFTMINPIHHGKNQEKISIYKIEPYVTAGDVYSTAPHEGRGGWSWYTGSAGWMYQLLVESLLGIQLEKGNQLVLKPSMPSAWEGFSCHYHYRSSTYQITIKARSQEQNGLIIDGEARSGNRVILADDGKTHEVIYQI